MQGALRHGIIRVASWTPYHRVERPCKWRSCRGTIEWAPAMITSARTPLERSRHHRTAATRHRGNAAQRANCSRSWYDDLTPQRHQKVPTCATASWTTSATTARTSSSSSSSPDSAAPASPTSCQSNMPAQRSRPSQPTPRGANHRKTMITSPLQNASVPPG